MPLNINCLSEYSDFELIPLIGNNSKNFIHSIYKLDEDDFISKFSSFIRGLLFSSNDFELLLKNFTINSFKLSNKLISSIIIYSIGILLMVIMLSIIFYIISYTNIKQDKSKKQTYFKFNLKALLVLLLFIIYFFIFIQMILLIKHGNKAKISLEKSIKLINEEFNSNIISQHFKYLLEQFNNYSKKSSSIIIDGSKSLMIKSLNNLLNDYYYIEEINLHIVNINKYFNEINSFIDNDQNIKVLFNKITKSYEYIMKDINNLNKKLCYYINENNIEIEKKIFYLFNLINEKFQFFIQIINEEILNKFFKSKLFNQNQQEKIQSFISLIATLFFSIILIITIVPFVFLIIIIINDFCLHSSNQTKQFKNQKTHNESSSKLDDLDVKQLISLHTHSNDSQSCYTTNSFSNTRNVSRKKHKSRKIRTYHISANGERTFSYAVNVTNRNKSKNARSYRLFLGSIRISFGFLIVLLIILCIISGLLYGLDLLIENSCRLVHHDQQYLISLITDNLIKSIENFDMNTTINNIINDCNKNKHFSKKFLKEYSNELNNELIPIMKYLNGNIYKEFLISIKMINISSEIDLLNNLASFLRLKHIQNRLILIHNDFNQIERIFKQIIQFNSRLPIQFLTRTLNEFELFFEKIIESTMNPCPLPIDNILKIDKLICHETANTINGLWLLIFLFMFSLVFGFCIFGIYIYKRFN
ncbi:unnamed protein product [Rotaria magnacalcarata]|uniref:Uncharacterized protein n=2 Tax=Rotaria magnacalcarata TaxID=392030 RepID=A0A816SCJ3_9BILA|nr:unnamed protein product [Rotaria magnacalcarata]CAF1658232.1 unnamed protein product [Rotaria magnacalcarata]CAF2069808.1 unnamed protein product [Rotaria magnacalcarata]CAF2082170.1 unnamed protein product [Rotaria magnacalcarata]CAF2181238.1 unnamed protein product [Rotaria magnacalcarata]